MRVSASSFDADDIEQLTLEIATLGKVTPAQQENALERSSTSLPFAQEYIAQAE